MKRKDECKKISAVLVVVLALIAAMVSIGLIAGYAMWPWIVIYWMVLTGKNLVDHIGNMEEKDEG